MLAENVVDLVAQVGQNVCLVSAEYANGQCEMQRTRMTKTFHGLRTMGVPTQVRAGRGLGLMMIRQGEGHANLRWRTSRVVVLSGTVGWYSVTLSFPV